MPSLPHPILAYGLLLAAVLSVAACTPRRIPPMTVADLMEDRVTLDGVLMKCNDDRYLKTRNEIECLNARVAAERLAEQKDVNPELAKQRQEEFERRREQLRLAEQKKREAEEAKTKVDAYSLPVIPVDPPQAQAPGQNPGTGTPPQNSPPPAARN